MPAKCGHVAMLPCCQVTKAPDTLLIFGDDSAGRKSSKWGGGWSGRGHIGRLIQEPHVTHINSADKTFLSLCLRPE